MAGRRQVRSLSRRGMLKAASALGGGLALAPLSGALAIERRQLEGQVSAAAEPRSVPLDATTKQASPPLVAYHEPGLPATISDSLSRFLDGGNPALAVTQADPFAAAPDVYVGTAPPEGISAREVDRIDFVPVVHHRRATTTISLDSLKSIFVAGTGNWSALGGASERLQLAVERKSVPLVAKALGVTPPRLPSESENPLRYATASWADRVEVYDTPDGVVEHVSRNRNSLGILPAGSLSFEVKPLAVGGAHPITSADPWPLGAKIWVGARAQVLSSDRLGQLRDTLDASQGDPEPTVTLTAVGDVMFGRRTDLRMFERNDYTAAFHNTGKELASADITVANFEGPITDRVTPIRVSGTYTFSTLTRATKGLNYAGFDALSLANNHTLNLGAAALLDTFKALDAAGIKYFGAGSNLAEARSAAIVERKGVRFAFLGYDDVTGAYYGATASKPGTAPLNVKNVVADVKSAREKADVVIPYFHWGIEYELYPNTRQRDVAKACVEAGASLVLGSHPHWVQTIEFYQGVLIAYSLGNFVFDQPWVETQQGIALRMTWRGKKLANFDVLPIRIYDLFQPRWLDPRTGEGKLIVERMYEASPENFRRKT